MHRGAMQAWALPTHRCLAQRVLTRVEVPIPTLAPPPPPPPAGAGCGGQQGDQGSCLKARARRDGCLPQPHHEEAGRGRGGLGGAGGQQGWQWGSWWADGMRRRDGAGRRLMWVLHLFEAQCRMCDCCSSSGRMIRLVHAASACRRPRHAAVPPLWLLPLPLLAGRGAAHGTA